MLSRRAGLSAIAGLSCCLCLRNGLEILIGLQTYANNITSLKAVSRNPSEIVRGVQYFKLLISLNYCLTVPRFHHDFLSF